MVLHAQDCISCAAKASAWACKDRAQPRARVQAAEHGLPAHGDGRAADLHDLPAERYVSAQHPADADDAFVAHGGGLDGVPVREHDGERNHAFVGEIETGDGVASLVEHLARGELHRLYLRQDQPLVVLGEESQELVAVIVYPQRDHGS
jgi:hypothetical protein